VLPQLTNKFSSSLDSSVFFFTLAHWVTQNAQFCFFAGFFVCQYHKWHQGRKATGGEGLGGTNYTLYSLDWNTFIDIINVKTCRKINISTHPFKRYDRLSIQNRTKIF
jgi:hypothetical protein